MREGMAPTSGVSNVSTDSAPCSWMASSMWSAISVSAWSQEIGSKRPSPRSPTRLSGWVTRSGE
jgi:hypothetical protein